MSVPNTLAWYFRNIAKIPLLSKHTEIELGIQVQRMIAERDCIPHESQDKRVITKGLIAKNKLVEANLRLVVNIAKKYQSLGLPLEDLIQEGNVGLIIAAEKFDPTKGYRFSTYAYWRIKNEITRAISNKSRIIRLPLNVVEKIQKIKKTWILAGRESSRIKVAQEINVTEQELKHLLGWWNQSVVKSLNYKIGESGTEVLEMIEDESFSPYRFEIQEEIKSFVENILSSNLTDRQKFAIALLCGLNDKKPLSYSEAGKALEISSANVKQAELAGMAKLKKAARRSKLEF